MRDRIDRNLAKEFQFDARGIVRLGYPLDERLEIRRISFASRSDVHRRNDAGVDRILVLVDGGAHLAQHAVELRFALPADRDPRERHDGRRKDQQNRGDDEEFDEGKSCG